MVGAVLLNCVSTVFPPEASLLLFLISDVGALPACRVGQMAGVLVKCSADLAGIAFYFLVSGKFQLIFFSF